MITKKRKALAAVSSISLAVALLFAGCQKAEQKLQGEEAYILGQESYVYGFPLVMMDVTRQVQTAADNPGEYSAPLNQFSMMHK